MEAIVKEVAVYYKGVSGCQRFNRDIMVTMTIPTEEPNKEGVEFVDMFLTTEQAESLVAQLMRRIADNTNEEL